MRRGGPHTRRVLEIGPAPPPVQGWSFQIKLLVDELRRRGHVCEVLNLGETRRQNTCESVPVRSGLDYLCKLAYFAAQGYDFHIHTFAKSRKAYCLALSAELIAKLARRRVILSFHGGLPQAYFPRLHSGIARWAFQLLFHGAGRIICNGPEMKKEIEGYGIKPERVAAIPGFSVQYLQFRPAPIGPEANDFLCRHFPVFVCYVCFRPWYTLDTLRTTMTLFRQHYPNVGFIWAGFSPGELAHMQNAMHPWSSEELRALLLLGNLPHDEFMSLVHRCFASIRTPVCDGVSAFVMESLAIGVPVIASENGRRPCGVITYQQNDPADLCAKMVYVAENYAAVKRGTRSPEIENNIARTADWIVEELPGPAAETELVRIPANTDQPTLSDLAPIDNTVEET